MGESPRRSDTELYGETNEKDSRGPRSLAPTRRFRVNARLVVRAQRVDATPSNHLMRQYFPPEQRSTGGIRSKPNQGSVLAGLRLASDLAFVFNPSGV